jgi:hypothetical protein
MSVIERCLKKSLSGTINALNSNRTVRSGVFYTVRPRVVYRSQCRTAFSRVECRAEDSGE